MKVNCGTAKNEIQTANNSKYVNEKLQVGGRISLRVLCVLCGDSFWRGEHPLEPDKNHGSDFRKFKSRFFPRSSSASEIHSSAVCACAMSPGPNTTLGIPPAERIAASQKKWTPIGFV